jgi:voltage-gated potassium channel
MCNKKLLFPILIIFVVLFSGIFGYMTIITLSTVGYGEVRNIGPAGRIFTILLILFGVSIIAYIVGLVAETLVESEIRSIFGRKKLSKKIRSLKNHYIICGYGRIGRIICKELIRKSIPPIVIEKDEQVRRLLDHNELLYPDADATEEEVLVEAGIEKAKGLVAVVSSDPQNVYIPLTARGLNPLLYILSRAEDEATEKKVIRAGANEVMLPYRLGGRRMAQAILSPTVSDFIESTIHDHSFELNPEEIMVGEDSQLNTLTLVDSLALDRKWTL